MTDEQNEERKKILEHRDWMEPYYNLPDYDWMLEKYHVMIEDFVEKWGVEPDM